MFDKKNYLSRMDSVLWLWGEGWFAEHATEDSFK